MEKESVATPSIVAVEWMPGERELFHFFLEKSDSDTDEWIDIPLNSPCSIVPGHAYDVGTLKTIVAERVILENQKKAFRYTTGVPSRKNRALESLKIWFPTVDLKNTTAWRQDRIRVSDCQKN